MRQSHQLICCFFRDVLPTWLEVVYQWRGSFPSSCKLCTRGLLIPAGKHEILFRFEPDVIARGSRIRLAGYGIFSLIVLVFFVPFKRFGLKQ